MPKFGDLGSNIGKQMSDLKISPFEILYNENFVKRLENGCFLPQNA